MKNKLILFLLVIAGSMYILPAKLAGQACVGSTAALSVLNGVRVSTDVIEFDLWFNNTNPAIPIKTSGINGALTGIGGITIAGTYTVVEPPAFPAPTGALLLTVVNVGALKAMRIVQTATGEGSAPTMPLGLTKFGRFRFTRTGGPALPAGSITLSWTTTGATVPTIVGYCNGNPNSSLYTVAGANLVATGFTILAPLPVELTDLEALPLQSNNLVNWSTASELNSQFHIVERSADGIGNWQEIGRVNAGGTTTEKQRYHFTDERPLPMSYYRLKMVDFDGKFEYSKIVSVERKVEEFAVTSVFPVPTNQKVTLQVASTEASSLTITITDLVGRTVSITNMDAEKGINGFELDVYDLASGSYFVKIDNGFKILTERIIKQ